MTYATARKHHEYLWSLAPAEDMSGAYEDQYDLAKLMKSPTKATARQVYIDQIHYWFQAGPDHYDIDIKGIDVAGDAKVRSIARAHHCEDRLDALIRRLDGR